MTAATDDAHQFDPENFPMRITCGCGSSYGRIRQRGAQDCVYCNGCDRLKYNAPRTETGKPVRHVKTREALAPKVRARILMRATGRCELCGTRPGDSALMHIGHLVSVKDGKAQGMTDDELNSDENLCAICDACNLGMGKETVPLRLAVAMVLARARNKK